MILDKAMQTARSLEDGQSDPARSHAFMRIAGARAKLGDLNAALAVIGLIRKDWKPVTQNEVATAQAKMGDFTAATATAHSIGDDDWRDISLIEIAKEQANISDFTAALTTATSISNQRGNSFIALRYIALKQAETGDKQAASSTLKLPIAQLSLINEEFIKANRSEEIASALGDIGDFDAALKLARAITNEELKRFALSRIALSQAKAGHVESTRATLDEVLRLARVASDYRVLKDIAVAQVKIGDVKAAHSTFDNALKQVLANKPNSDSDIDSKANLLVHFAETAIEMGDRPAASDVFDAAVDTARQIKDTRANGICLEWIARPQIKAGEFPKAVKTVRAISGEMARARALARIATLEMGDANRREKAEIIREALLLAGSVADHQRDLVHEVLIEVARAQAQLGLGAEATATLRRVFHRMEEAGQKKSLTDYMHQEITGYCKGLLASGNVTYVRDLAEELTDAQSQGRFSLYMGLAEAILDQQTPAAAKK